MWKKTCNENYWELGSTREKGFLRYAKADTYLLPIDVLVFPVFHDQISQPSLSCFHDSLPKWHLLQRNDILQSAFSDNLCHYNPYALRPTKNGERGDFIPSLHWRRKSGSSFPASRNFRRGVLIPLKKIEWGREKPRRPASQPQNNRSG